MAETKDVILMLEPKARGELTSAEVLAKRAAADEWCGRASQYSACHAGKQWRYVLIPHDAIAENVTLPALVSQFGS